MTELTPKDQVFAKPLSSVKAFEFDAQVARVFDDMISRSVPGYELLLRLIALYADIFVTENSCIYDLGCSTGLVSRVVHQQVNTRQCAIYAVDSSTAMIERCRETQRDIDVTWLCADIEQQAIEDASLVILNLTLQFIQPDRRSAMLQRIFGGLNPGGALVLTEKIEFEDVQTQAAMTDLYQAFKKNRGYSDLEISQKRTALENVLNPETALVHEQRLAGCGFDVIHECFRCLNFVSYLAIKA